MKVGVTGKFILLFMPALVLSLLIPGLFFIAQQKQILQRHFDQRMTHTMNDAVAALQTITVSPRKDILEPILERVMSQQDVVSCCLRDVNGHVIMEKGDTSMDDTIPYTRTVVFPTGSPLAGTVSTSGEDSKALIPGELTIVAARGRLHAEMDRGERIMSMVLLASIGITLLFLGLILATLVDRPLRLLTSGVNTILQQGNLCHRIYMDRHDEFEHLADAFNQMTDELKQIVVRDRDLETVADYEHNRALVLGRANEDLDHINKELRDFAHIISHDLKTPLRGIRSLTDWIVRDYADQFDEEGKSQVALLASRVERMQNLIDGILEYSKAGYDQGEYEDVDLNRIVVDIINDIAPPKHINISIKNTLPVVHIHKTKIIQVFQNLIGNAVKYNDKPIGVVSVSCQDKGDHWQFSVADNGAGIEEKYYEKIFHMFQILSLRDQCDSTGVGLAVVKRIIDGWGGRIWVRSRIGEGSIFVFKILKQIKRVHHEKYQTSIASGR